MKGSDLVLWLLGAFFGGAIVLLIMIGTSSGPWSRGVVAGLNKTKPCVMGANQEVVVGKDFKFVCSFGKWRMIE